MDTFFKVLIGILCLATLTGVIYLPSHYIHNRISYTHKKIDEATDYDTLKNVEDTCRAMIASYQADILVWEQYKDSENAEQVSWANTARTRANRTAASYNEYIRKNSYVWADNVPNDIDEKLDYVN